MTNRITWLIGLALCPTLAQAQKVDFNRDIRPILAENCFFCHGPDAKNREAELRLDTKDGLFGKGSELPIVTPGDPKKSSLWDRIVSNDPDHKMPPVDSRKELTKKQKSLVEQWIRSGAGWQSHWAYTRVTRPQVPKSSDSNWPLSDVDRFVLSRLEKERLRPSDPADEATLVRRLHFDLLGLPPKQADVVAYRQSKSPTKYVELVDRLLRSPHFGERMAVYWLDLVRYADTVGYHGDQDHAISPYRDYVIKAFNDNMPFSRFTIEQLAGDLLPTPTTDQHIATGYNRVLQTSHEGGVQRKEYLAKYSADRVRNVSSVWMGVTLGCAECHNHKYDPFTQKDFYSLVAFFADVDDNQTFSGSNSLPTSRKPEMTVLSPITQAEVEAQMVQLEKRKGELASVKNDVAKREPLQKAIAALEKKIKSLQSQKQRTMVTVAIKPRDIRVLTRGDWLDTSGALVSPAIPEFLGKLNTDGRSNRLQLAQWLVSRENPLTARVFVNRIWKLFYGVGLSKRLDDVGAQGEPPTHPELLDWLAAEFMESGWDVKHLVKTMVMTRTYQQSSALRTDLDQRDPENRLFARQASFRLDAEFLRDNALAISGLLVRRLGGRPARPYQPAGYYQHLNFPKRKYTADKGEDQYRRGVYMHWQRVFLHPMLKAFDAPSREECTAERPRSNTPLGALVMLNDPTMIEAAREFAVRIIREGGDGTQARIQWAWRESLNRDATTAEIALISSLVEADLSEYKRDVKQAERLIATGNSTPPKDIPPATLAAWTGVARAILNLHELITRN